MRLIFSAFGRIFGQGFLALTSFFVSFAAAHSLNSKVLAAFFVAWTLESMWVAAVRGIYVPAFLASTEKPRILASVLAHSVLVIPMVVAIWWVSIKGELDHSASLLLAATPILFGTYEVLRVHLSVSVSSSLSLADGMVFVLSAVGFALAYLFLGWASLNAALSGLLVGSGIVLSLGIWRQSSLGSSSAFMSFAGWIRMESQIIRVGLLEWVIFFVISMAGVALLGGIGGADVLSGVRLAETLVAPLSIASSAIPLILAPYMSSLSDSLRAWPKIVLLVTWGFALAASIWVATALLLPVEVVEILVGAHGELAKAGLAGLFLGVVMSFFGVSVTLILKARGSLKEIRLIRWIQLFLSVPLIAVGSLTGNVFYAGLAMSGHQLVAGCLLIWFERRSRRGGQRAGRLPCVEEDVTV